MSADLSKYVQHLPGCVLRISRSPLANQSWCDCGLTAILSQRAPCGHCGDPYSNLEIEGGHHCNLGYVPDPAA